MVAAASSVFVGRFVELETFTVAGHRGTKLPQVKATVVIESVLKGDLAAGATLRIEAYDSGARGKALFLGSPFKGRFVTTGMLKLDPPAENTLVLRMRELVSVLAISDESDRKHSIVEWAVRSAENEATRWYGLVELSGPARFIGSGTASEHIDLTADQILRLRSVFESIKDHHPNDALILARELARSGDERAQQWLNRER